MFNLLQKKLNKKMSPENQRRICQEKENLNSVHPPCQAVLLVKGHGEEQRLHYTRNYKPGSII